MLIGFTAQNYLQLCLPGIRLFRPIRVGALRFRPNVGRLLVPYIEPRRKVTLSSAACVLVLQLFFKYLLQQFFTEHVIKPASAWAGCSPVEVPRGAWPINDIKASQALASTGDRYAHWSAAIDIRPVSSYLCSALPVGCESWFLLCIFCLSCSGPFPGAQSNTLNGPV